MRYGFLGMGIMGQGMAANLQKAGHEVTVWNRNAAKCGPLEALGAKVGATPSEVVAGCEVTFAMVSDPAASEAVCLGPDGVLDGLSAGKGYVDMSTIDPGTSRDLAEAVADQGGRYLEAPVSGTKQPAADGTLVILAAGHPGLFEEVEPAFSAMGKKSFFLGEVGQAAKMKLAVNMVMGGMMTAFCEGLGLADKCGLKQQDLLDVLAVGALANPMFAGKGPKMISRDFTAAFPLKHLEKDMRLALELGGDCGQGLHTAEAARELFVMALRNGLGDEDFSAVFKSVVE